jgi:hypothetical protein
MQTAKRRGYGTHTSMTIYVEFYNRDGKSLGANRRSYVETKTRAKERFRNSFKTFLQSCGWDYRISFEFGDDSK